MLRDIIEMKYVFFPTCFQFVVLHMMLHIRYESQSQGKPVVITVYTHNFKAFCTLVFIPQQVS